MNAMDLITRIDSLVRVVSPRPPAVSRATQTERSIAANASSNSPSPANPPTATSSLTDTESEKGSLKS